MIDQQQYRDKYGRLSEPPERRGRDAPDLQGDDPRWASLRYDGQPDPADTAMDRRVARLGLTVHTLKVKNPQAAYAKAWAALQRSKPSCTCECRCDEQPAVEVQSTSAANETASDGLADADGFTVDGQVTGADADNGQVDVEAFAPDGSLAQAGLAQARGEGEAIDALAAGEADGDELADISEFALDGQSAEQVLVHARADVEAALDALLAMDVDAADGGAVREHAVATQRLVNKAQAAQVAAAGAVDSRGAYIADGAVNAQAWLRNRIRSDHGEALRLVQAGRRLRQFPQLAATFQQGGCSLSHVAAVTRSAVPSRVAALADNDAVFAELAKHATPKDMGRAVKRVRDLVDPDGTTTTDNHDGGQEHPPGLDPRRGLHLSRTMDDLWELRATLDPLQGEALKTVLDGFDQPDPADTTEEDSRSPAQRRADALAQLATAALNAGLSPQVQGYKPHLLVLVDLQTLLGNPDLATFETEARFTGQIDLDDVLRVWPDCKFTAVLADGPYRAVSVGRTQRSMPSWMRPVMEALHRRCRGPDCDRPVSWTEAHHTVAWADNGDTDLNQMIPLCKRHHDLVTNNMWTVAYIANRGACLWRNHTTGKTITTKPPPRGSPLVTF